MTLDTPFGITFVSKPAIDDAYLIPDQCVLKDLDVSDSAISYTFADPDTLTPEVILVASFLQLDKVTEMLRKGEGFDHINRIMRHRGATARLRRGGGWAGMEEAEEAGTPSRSHLRCDTVIRRTTSKLLIQASL